MAVSSSTDTESWYSQELGQIYDALEIDADGLSTEEATNRLSEFGPNRLPKGKPVTVWQIFVRQFKNPLIYILGLAAIVSFAIGEETDAGFITAVLLINALVGGVQEWRAERSSQALQQLILTRATVIRDGEARDIDGEEVVPGDVVLLESGYRVPADIRLLSTHGLEIDESADEVTTGAELMDASQEKLAEILETTGCSRASRRTRNSRSTKTLGVSGMTWLSRMTALTMPPHSARRISGSLWGRWEPTSPVTRRNSSIATITLRR